jgi:hypothetical protein
MKPILIIFGNFCNLAIEKNKNGLVIYTKEFFGGK